MEAHVGLDAPDRFRQESFEHCRPRATPADEVSSAGVFCLSVFL
jgi:hypothetical protein